MFASPSAMVCEAIITVLMLDPHTLLLTVVAPIESGIPAPIEACLAGA